MLGAESYFAFDFFCLQQTFFSNLVSFKKNKYLIGHLGSDHLIFMGGGEITLVLQFFFFARRSLFFFA